RGVVAADGRVPGMHDAGDRGRQIDVDPAALALAILPAGAAAAARGLVAGHVYRLQVHGGRTTDVEAAALADAAVAARPASTAQGLRPRGGCWGGGGSPGWVRGGSLGSE